MTDEQSPAPRAPKASRAAAPDAGGQADPAQTTSALKTPEQWAELLGELAKGDPRLPQSKTHHGWRHAAANTLYGWSEHAYHYADQPFVLSEENYLAGLEAAINHPPQEPHAPAFPPSRSSRANQEKV